MRNTHGARHVAFGLAAALALVLAGTVSIYRVLADAGISPEIDVNIFSPVPGASTLTVTAYATDGEVPPSMPLGVKSTVEELAARGATPVITDVRTVLGGDFASGSITGELQSRQASLVNTVGAEDEFLAVVEGSLLDFQPVVRGTSTPLFASDFIRTVAIADSYYSSRTVAGIAEYDPIGVNFTLRNLDEIDTDGNLIPDATALLEDEFLLSFDSLGNTTVAISLESSELRGSPINHEVSLQTVLGPINLSLTASSLADIIAESGGALSAFNTGRLIVSLSDDPAELVQEPSSADPLAEFDLEDGGDPLPPPVNLFVRVNVALTAATRGLTAPTWTFLDTLPGSAFFSLEVNGPGIAALLEDGIVVGAYTYDVELTQDTLIDENIIAAGEINPDGWVDISDDVSLFNLYNADNAADTRLQNADNGDDTIVISGNNVSAIYGSNAFPRIGDSDGGGGGNGLCFIATAAFGTPLAREIQTLRGVRDEYMLSNVLGSLFADTYYRLSPPIAGEVAQNGMLKSVVRAALIPAVALSRWLLASPGSVVLVLVSLGAAAAFARQFRRAS